MIFDLFFVVGSIDSSNSISQDTWLNFIGSILTIILSTGIAGVTAYKSSLRGIKSEHNKIDKQISAEMEKLRLQYKYEQKRDNSNFLYRFKLEKLAELYELVGQFNRQSYQLSLQSEKFFRSKKLQDITEEDKQLFKEERTTIEQGFFEKNIMRSISMNMSFFPNIDKQWIETSRLHSIIVEQYPDQILSMIVVKNPDLMFYKIPEDYTLNDFFEDINRVRVTEMNLLDAIQEEIRSIMQEMENKK
ncbi:hypothetical protein ACYSNU_12115 [Enterococcus sp. LJL120]